MTTLNIYLQDKPYKHDFIVADVVHNILGYDFWSNYQMYLKPTLAGVEVYASDLTPLLKVQQRLQKPSFTYRALQTVNAIFPSDNGINGFGGIL